jgi:hypothetical protein
MTRDERHRAEGTSMTEFFGDGELGYLRSRTRFSAEEGMGRGAPSREAPS